MKGEPAVFKDYFDFGGGDLKGKKDEYMNRLEEGKDEVPFREKSQYIQMRPISLRVAVVQWNQVRSGGREIFKGTGSNPGHGLKGD